MSFKHCTPIEIRFVDLDVFGHVNNANYLTYLEQARVKYFDDLVGWEYDWSKEGIILAQATLNFLVPIKLKDLISVYTRCERIGNKSLLLEYRIVKKNGVEELLMADARTVLVAFDYVNRQSIQVPERWKEAILGYEGEL